MQLPLYVNGFATRQPQYTNVALSENHPHEQSDEVDWEDWFEGKKNVQRSIHRNNTRSKELLYIHSLKKITQFLLMGSMSFQNRKKYFVPWIDSWTLIYQKNVIHRWSKTNGDR